tara:strand:- start:1172 stop:1348 length:177 start_codon:yes stop_codon:yes gene_type:complete
MKFNFRVYDHVLEKYLHEVVIEASSYANARKLGDSYLEEYNWDDQDVTYSFDEVKEDE